MITNDAQKLDVDAYIVLFQMDIRRLGGDVFYFTPNVYADKLVRWRDIADPPGVTDYTPIDVKGEGFEITTQGSLPRPTLTVSNTKLMFAPAVREFNDFKGGILYRYRTLKKYLVGESDEDLDAHFPVDVYVIERKTESNKFYITWELASLVDCQGVKIPKGQILREGCQHIYRWWNGTAFDYTQATCPYSWPACYDKLGRPTTDPKKDACGRRLFDCKLRFGQNGWLPTTAFPAVAKVRV